MSQFCTQSAEMSDRAPCSLAYRSSKFANWQARAQSSSSPRPRLIQASVCQWFGWRWLFHSWSTYCMTDSGHWETLERLYQCHWRLPASLQLLSWFYLKDYCSLFPKLHSWYPYWSFYDYSSGDSFCCCVHDCNLLRMILRRWIERANSFSWETFSLRCRGGGAGKASGWRVFSVAWN